MVVTPNDFMQGTYTGEILVDDMEKVFTSLLATYLHTSDFNVVVATVTDD
jgi:hypothetical protein